MRTRVLKSTVIMTLLMALVVGITMPALAAGNNTYYSIDTNTKWKTVAKSTNGFDCKVRIFNHNAAVARSDVKMLGKNGNVVWQESGALPGYAERIFDCGSDVYEIQVKTQSGLGSAYASYAGELR